VVLGRDGAPTGAQVDAGLVEPAVAVLQLVGPGPRREAQELVPEAYAEDGAGRVQPQGVPDAAYRLWAHGRISRSVAQEQAVPTDAGGIRLEVVIEGHDRQFHPVPVH
jgi:hypothetical protein